jgi:hypothetical protein
MAGQKETSDKFKDFKKNNPPKKEDPKGKGKIKKTNQEDQSPELEGRIKNLETVENKRQFGYDNGLSPKETDYVFKFSGGKPTEKTLKDPFVKAGLEALRRTERIRDNTPDSGQTFSAGGKTWEQMTPAEKKVNFPEYMKSRRKQR